MDWIGWILRLAHVLAAIVLAGGLIYRWLVQLPALAEIASGERERLAEALRRRQARLVALATLFLLASGFYNYFVTIQAAGAGQIELAWFYHPVVGVKILLAFGVFLLASLLSGRTPVARRMQLQVRTWLPVAVIFTLIVVALASLLHVSGRRPADAAANEPSASAFRQTGETAISDRSSHAERDNRSDG